ncbi:MAG: phenylacetate--CoA ligase family protein [Bacillota bacterium]
MAAKVLECNDNPFLHPEIETMPGEMLRNLQFQKFKKVLKKAYAHSPFYRKICQDVGVSPDDIKEFDDIQKLPFLEKKLVRDAYPFGLLLVPQEMVSEYHTTSGTTGKAIAVCATKEDMERWAKLNARSLWMCGCRPGDILLMSFAYGLATGIGFHYGAQQMGMGVVPGGIGRTDFLIDLIRDFGITTITTTPTYGLHLAEKALERGINLATDTRLKFGLFGAEPWPESTRAKLEEMLGIEAYNEYGMGEFLGPGMACECQEKNGMHIWSDSLLVECINPETGKWVKDGEQGEIVWSWIGSDTCAMLRYRSHDVAAVHSGECPCGRTHPKLGRIMGRSDDAISISGYVVFPSKVNEVLNAIPELGNNFRLIIESKGSLDHLTVKAEVKDNLFLADDHQEQLAKKVVKEVKTYLGMTPTVELVPPNSLPRDEEHGKTASKRIEDRRKWGIK